MYSKWYGSSHGLSGGHIQACLEGLQKTMKILSHDGRSLDQDLNLEPSKYEEATLTSQSFGMSIHVIRIEINYRNKTSIWTYE